ALRTSRRAAEPAAFGVPALQGAAAGGVGGAGVAGVVGGVGGWGAGGVVGFQAAAQLGPGVAAGSVSGGWRAELVEVGSKGTMALGRHAPVCLPYAHQGADEVPAAAFRLEGV